MRIAALIALSWVMQPLSLQAAGCSDAWIQAVEKQLSVGDGQGHGPAARQRSNPRSSR
ncbi:MAG: hypothetical protein KDI48_17790 [Xanthomonadales bacterium]|nr:hypothetical protein [Xanthomonadales bacterium]